MDPLPLSWHDGCYCYRENEAEEARQLGFEVRCGGGLPCSCMLFDSDSFAPVDPLFNSAETVGSDYWIRSPADDPLKSDVWPVQPDAQLALQQEHQQVQPSRTSNKRSAPESGCCGCACRQMHREEQAKKKRCCGDNCKCSSGTCECPEDIVNSAGKCCQGTSTSMSRIGTRMSGASAVSEQGSTVASQASLPPRAQNALPDPVSEVSSPENDADSMLAKLVSGPAGTSGNGLEHRRAASTPASASPFSSSNALPTLVKRERAPVAGEAARSCCDTATSNVPSISLPPRPPKVPLSASVRSGNPVKSEVSNARILDESSANAFKCSDCPQTFATQHELESHGAKKHQKRRPYTCTTCSASFLFKQNRDRHIVEVHDGKRPHQCPHSQCGAAFKNSSGLKQHMRTVHDKQRPFKCEHCPSSFGQRNHLTQHVVVVHLRRKNFQCSICDTSFSNRGNLNQHVRRKHEGKATSSRPKAASTNTSG